MRIKIFCLILFFIYTPLSLAQDKIKCNVEGVSQLEFDSILKDLWYELRMTNGLDPFSENVNSYCFQGAFDNIKNKKIFDRKIKEVANSIKCYDKKEAYIWKGDIKEYPKPFVFDEIVKTQKEYLFYENRVCIFISLIESVNAIKYRYYYKGILCHESDGNKPEYYSMKDQTNRTA